MKQSQSSAGRERLGSSPSDLCYSKYSDLLNSGIDVDSAGLDKLQYDYSGKNSPPGAVQKSQVPPTFEGGGGRADLNADQLQETLAGNSYEGAGLEQDSV